MTVAFVDEHSQVLGVEPVCRALQIAPSTYYENKARRIDPERRSTREKTDAALQIEIGRIWHENFENYGARKVWLQLGLEGWDVARCTVERLMRKMGLRGVVRGRKVRTTIPSDRVNIP
jgi:putative transposase